jgi:hypothetical protein
MMSAPEIAEINRRVNLRELAMSLGAKFKGASNNGSCPICGGEGKRTRFAIKRKGGAEAWVCAVCQTGGDAIALVQKVKGLDFRAAVAELGGPVNLAPEEIARRERAAAEKAEREAAAKLKFRERARRELYAVWQAAAPFLGTPVEAYLRGRGLTWRLQDLCLRYAPDLPYFDGETVDEAGRRAPRLVHRGPAMLAAFVGADGRFMSLHRTWIDPRQPGAKARIADPETGEALPAKKMRGHKQGGWLRLLGVEADPRRCVVGEGIETVLSVREAERDDRFYFAAGDLGNLAGAAMDTLAHPTLRQRNGRPLRAPDAEPRFDSEAMPLPAACVDLLLLKDGDSDAFTTELAMRRAAARHAAPGRTIRCADAPEGKDFNDVLRGAA